MRQFIENNPSLSMVFLSTIMTGIIAEELFASLIVHVANLGLLGAMWWAARDTSRNNTVTYILMLISLGITGLMTEPTPGRLAVEALNFALLLAIVWVSSQEGIDIAAANTKRTHGARH